NGLLLPRRLMLPPAWMRPPAAPGRPASLAGVAAVGLRTIELLPRVALHPRAALLEGFRRLRLVGFALRGLLQNALADFAVRFVLGYRRGIGFPFRAVRFVVFLERGVLSVFFSRFQHGCGFRLRKRVLSVFFVRDARMRVVRLGCFRSIF